MVGCPKNQIIDFREILRGICTEYASSFVLWLDLLIGGTNAETF